MGHRSTDAVPLDQLVSDCLHNIAILAYDVTEGVSDVSVGVGLVMHSEADVHGTIQVGRGFGLAQSRAGDSEIVHAVIIGTGSGDLGALVDTCPTGTLSVSAEHFCIQIEILILILIVGQPDLLLNPGNLCSCFIQTLTQFV